MFNFVLIYSVILLMGKTMMRYPLGHHNLPIFDLILRIRGKLPHTVKFTKMIKNINFVFSLIVFILYMAFYCEHKAI